MRTNTVAGQQDHHSLFEAVQCWAVVRVDAPGLDAIRFAKPAITLPNASTGTYGRCLYVSLDVNAGRVYLEIPWSWTGQFVAISDFNRVKHNVFVTGTDLGLVSSFTRARLLEKVTGGDSSWHHLCLRRVLENQSIPHVGDQFTR